MSRKLVKTCTLFHVLLFILFFFIFTEPIGAHSALKGTTPSGSEVLKKSPSTIEVWFKDPVEIHKESLQLIDTDGNKVPIGNTEVDPEDSTHIIAKLDQELKPGKYSVKINTIAQDGYVINEEFTFSVKDTAIKNKSFGILELVKSNLQDGIVYEQSPKQMELVFNQPVNINVVGIFDDKRAPISTKAPESDPDNPNKVIIPFTEELASGTYQVTWIGSPANNDKQVLANQGVFYFAIGEFTPFGIGGEVLNVAPSTSYGFTLERKQLAYWLMFVGLTMLFGIACFYTFIIKNQYLARWNKMNLLFYLISFSGITLLLVEQKLALSELSFSDFFLLKFSWIPIVQLILLTLGIWLKKVRFLLYGLALLLSPFIIGHATYPRYGGYITLVASSIHILGAAIWIGCLFAFIAKPKQENAMDWLKKAGPSFSKWAFISMIGIAVSGIWMSVAFLPSFSIQSLIESEWGRSLIVKVALFLFVISVAYFQRKTIKKLGSKLASSVYKKGWIELTYGVMIILFASTLVAANPSAAEQGLYKEPNPEQSLELDVKVTPIEIGLSTITIKLLEDVPVSNVRVKLGMPPDWFIENNAFKVDEGTYKLTGNLLHAAGTVNMTIKVTMENGEEIQIPYEIVVPGEIRFNE
ncbi:copper resistance protein CopC [Aquibacillus sp. 3ASR75-11]|uniref:Copper resistance protein CopC n=1 Tax=Terrihalobacillus insolitus TaxID=2950438 RepID=A0A9X3WX24_9BACI|nr:copper resistance protein CopC [Terrihalobacillus insolitus]MDC3425766.1 copper resistance protein CopC [Terrihalobacillus insolitus]